jgi:hypothetical protein
MISARPMGRPASMRCSTQSRPLVRRERAQPGRMMTGTRPAAPAAACCPARPACRNGDLAAGGDDGGRYRVGAILGHGAAGNQQQVAAGRPRFAQRRGDGSAAMRAALHQAEMAAEFVEPAPAAGHRRRVVARRLARLLGDDQRRAPRLERQQASARALPRRRTQASITPRPTASGMIFTVATTAPARTADSGGSVATVTASSMALMRSMIAAST